MDTTEAQPGANTNLNMTSPQTRRTHCDAQDSDAAQCLETRQREQQKLLDQVRRGTCGPNLALKLRKKPVKRKGVNPLAKEECVFKQKPHSELKKHGSFKLDSTQQPWCRGGKLETWTADEALEVKLA